MSCNIIEILGATKAVISISLTIICLRKESYNRRLLIFNMEYTYRIIRNIMYCGLLTISITKSTAWYYMYILCSSISYIWLQNYDSECY